MLHNECESHHIKQSKYSGLFSVRLNAIISFTIFLNYQSLEAFQCGHNSTLASGRPRTTAHATPSRTSEIFSLNTLYGLREPGKVQVFYETTRSVLTVASLLSQYLTPHVYLACYILPYWETVSLLGQQRSRFSTRSNEGLTLASIRQALSLSDISFRVYLGHFNCVTLILNSKKMCIFRVLLSSLLTQVFFLQVSSIRYNMLHTW